MGGLLIVVALVVMVIVAVFAQGEGAGELPTIGLRVIGQSELLADSDASVRIVVTDTARGVPLRGALVSVRLEGEGAPGEPLFVGRSDARGTVSADLRIPNLEPGDYTLVVHADANGAREKVEQSITISRAFQILLTTDKPIYQPTQTMHLRALALRLPGMDAAAGREITLEVSDGKGNKVFKHTALADDFGIVAADFILADEVNQGRYKIKAIMEDDSAEKTVTVSRYVLPKFKVTITPERDFYLPGQRVEGKVQADYFFGKPVSGGTVDLTVKTFDFEFRDIAHVTGVTDAEGSFRFEATLPDSFVGQPVEQGNAFLQFEVELTDQAEHTESAMVTSTVAASDLQVNALPEAGELVPGVDNIVFVMVSRPTGEPAEATVNLRVTSIAGDADRAVSLQPQQTDDLGIAQFTLPAVMTALLEPQELAQLSQSLRPLASQSDEMGRDGSSLMIRAEAVARDGSRVERDIELTADSRAKDASLLLRTDRALYRVGERLRATALTGVPVGTVYFDVVKDRQTMLTQVAVIKSGQAQTAITLGPQVTGTAWLSAYLITPRGQIIRDQRPIYIDPAADLSIDVAADRDTYLPGGDAKLDFTVRDSKGRPVAAALGINVVDESVFALQELQPGMEKIFFYLEQEMMEPRYEIHGFEMPSIIATEPGPVPLQGWERKDRAAQIIFASIEAPTVSTFDVDTYAELLSAAQEQWTTEMEPKVSKIRDAMHKYHEAHDTFPEAEHGLYKLVAQGYIETVDLKDLWDRDLILEWAAPETRDLDMAILISLGPDGKRDTPDDLVLPVASPWVLWQLGLGQPGGMMRGGLIAERAMPMAMGGAGKGAMREMADEAPPGEGGAGGGEDKASVRVRSYFPETMFFEPALITGPDGKATLTMPMADSITTWRLAALANSATGQLGSTTAGLRCFQDFFIDIDLPVALTQNDQVSIPVAVYNYLPGEQAVSIELTEEPWFELTGDATVRMTIAGNDVDVRYFTIKALKVGDHTLTVHGMGAKMSDALTREIRIEPDGQKVEQTVSDRLEKTVEHTLTIPEQALADASTILVKVYPGIFSQVVEGLDAMLRMPFGCFEQTSSVTYPNILVLNYMRTTDQVTPEIDMKAAGFINNGYQRMLSFECANGGFSWFGDEPANKMLTSFGLMEFYDMQSVHNVDRAVIARTQQWLLGQQEADGSWKPDEAYLHQETWKRIQNGNLLPTAYVTWALAATGEKGDGVQRGVGYVRENFKQAEDPYSLAICCNALVAADNALNDGELDLSTIAALDKLIGMAKEKGGRMWWESEITGITHSSGSSSDLEATGYAGLALLASGSYPGQTTAVINYLVSMKDAGGTWHSTQATILALKVLLLSQGDATQKVNAEVTVAVNGKQAESFAMTPANADVMRLIDCRELAKAGDNTVKISFSGEGSCLYQIVERHYMPWGGGEGPAQQDLLSINVDYDRTRLAKDDMLNAAITVRNNTPVVTSMIVVDLGIPPGFSVEAEDLANLVESGTIAKYKLTGRQIIVYLEELKANQVVKLAYRLRAKFPIKAKTPQSRVYEYYNPDNQATAAPEDLEVTG